MSLVYRSHLVELHHGDAIDVLRTLPRESVDLLLTDPPYGVEYQSDRRKEPHGALLGDGRTQREEIGSIIADCVRLVRMRRHMYVFGPADILPNAKVTEPVTIIWDKGTHGMGDLSSPWSISYERISFLVKTNDSEGTTNLPARMRKQAVLRFLRSSRNRHPTEKPLALLQELIESSSRQGETVLDPFAGVGSTGVAAILCGRRAILVELDERYVLTAMDRLKKAERIYNEMQGC